VVEAAIQYKLPARYDDLLVVETVLAQVRRASARFEYVVRRGEERLVTGHTVHACIDASGSIQRMPASLLERLAH
jgi:acyl-CoA thioester hydrolase